MINLKDLLKEETSGPAIDFAAKIEKMMKKYFPTSTCNARYDKHLSEHIYIRFAIGQQKDWSSGYIQNAPVDYTAFIFNIKDAKTNDRMKLESSSGAKIWTKPIDKPYHAYGRINVPTRKTTGGEDKIFKAIEKVMANLKKSTKDNLDIMKDEHQWVKKYI
jgi:hypothetical protein